MRIKNFSCRLLFVSATLPSGPALADEPVRGLVQFKYIADRPESGGSAGNSRGNAVTVAYVLSSDFLPLAEYEHLPHSLQPPGLGYREEDDYAAGLRFTYALNSTSRWITQLIYEEEHDTARAGASIERGFDSVQGLRIVITPRLELITDLHHETIGASTNAVTVGFVQDFDTRFGVEGTLEHSYSGGRYDNSYHLGFRVYY